MRRLAGVVCAAGLALGPGACAALSGLSSYRSGDCSEECDGNHVGTTSAADAEEADADASAIDEIKAADMQAGRDVIAEDVSDEGSDAVVDVADAESATTEPDTGMADAGAQDAFMDGTVEGAVDAMETGSEAASDAAADAGSDAPSDAGSDASDAGDLGVGLVAYYKFDEASGTAAADSSGNGRTAALVGATFSSGLQNNAVTLSGSNSYVSLPAGIVSGLTSFSICAWVNAKAPLTTWARLFDFGTGTTTYMFFTVNSTAGAPRFSITTAGAGQEQQITGTAPLATGSWQHVAVTLTAGTATLYIGGAPVAQNTRMTLSPSSLGSTTQNWLGRSEFATDPYLNGQIDNFRIYDRALSAADVQALYVGNL